jgi:hypothetical protein
MVLPNTGFLVEAEGRYARLKNLKKATAMIRDDGGSETTEGRLHLATYMNDKKGWSIFTVAGNPFSTLRGEFTQSRRST